MSRSYHNMKLNLCEPAKLYLAILVVYYIIRVFYQRVTLYSSVVDLVVGVFWVWVLSFLCRKRMKDLAWAFVLLPFVFIGSAFIYGGGVFREGVKGKGPSVKSPAPPAKKIVKRKVIMNKRNPNSKIATGQEAAAVYKTIKK